MVYTQILLALVIQKIILVTMDLLTIKREMDLETIQNSIQSTTFRISFLKSMKKSK